MKNRADAIIVLDSTHSCRSLKMIEAWKNSSFVVHVVPDAVYSGMTIKVGNAMTKKFVPAAKGVFHPIMGYWHFYLPRGKFLHGGDTMYEIDAVDIENSSRHVCGDGVLRIQRPILEDDDEGSVGNETDAYVNSNGTWYLIKVGEDEYGGLTLAVKEVMPTNVPSDVSGDSYAYNRQTGLFHKLTVEIDESGTPSIVVNGNGVEDVGGSFAFNSETGLYYRIEADVDESGALMVQIGEQQ